MMPTITPVHEELFFFYPGAENACMLSASCRPRDVFSVDLRGGQSSLFDARPSVSAWCLLALACYHLEDWQIVPSAVWKGVVEGSLKRVVRIFHLMV